MKHLLLATVILIFSACQNSAKESENVSNKTANQEMKDRIIQDGEVNFKSLKQLSFGGDNAEAYWSFDDSKLVFQVTNPSWELSCDQIFIFDWQKDDLETKIPQMVSTGFGRTTCSYFLPGDTSIVYASTHLVLSLIHI